MASCRTPAGSRDDRRHQPGLTPLDKASDIPSRTMPDARATSSDDPAAASSDDQPALGTATTSSGRTTQLVAPEHNGNLWRFTMGDLVAEIDAAVGASIRTFAYRGSNVLAASSWFRPSPQARWGWPPPAEVESAPFTASLDKEVVTFTGAVSARWGLQASKRIWADAADQTLNITYTLTNRSSVTASWAPWEVSRVHATGLTYFPEGTTLSVRMSAAGMTQLPLTTLAGVAWLDLQAPALNPGKYIVGRDGTEGWIAHIESGLVFIKSFTDTPAERLAPDEGEILLYTEAPPRAGGFLEVEDQGPIVALAPGASTSWTVHWRLRPLPKDLAVTAGSAALLQWTRGVLATGAALPAAL